MQCLYTDVVVCRYTDVVMYRYRWISVYRCGDVLGYMYPWNFMKRFMKISWKKWPIGHNLDTLGHFVQLENLAIYSLNMSPFLRLGQSISRDHGVPVIRRSPFLFWYRLLNLHCVKLNLIKLNFIKGISFPSWSHPSPTASFLPLWTPHKSFASYFSRHETETSCRQCF